MPFVANLTRRSLLAGIAAAPFAASTTLGYSQTAETPAAPGEAKDVRDAFILQLEDGEPLLCESGETLVQDCA